MKEKKGMGIKATYMTEMDTAAHYWQVIIFSDKNTNIG